MEAWLLLSLYILTSTVVGLVIASYKNGQLKLVYPAVIILLIRNCIPMLDLDHSLRNQDTIEKTLFIVVQPFAIIIIQVCLNFISPLKMIIFPSLIVCFLSTFGIFTIGGNGDTMYQLLIE